MTPSRSEPPPRLSLAGGMDVPDRWVYYALLVNCADTEGCASTAMRGPAVAAARTMFSLVQDRLRL